MPVLTRVCSPATLPRLKRFRFRPIDGESRHLSSGLVYEEIRESGRAKNRTSAALVAASIDRDSCSAGRPRANLKLVLNRSLSEPGPSPCGFPASPTASPIATSVSSSGGCSDSGNGSLSSNSSSNDNTASLPTSPCAENGGFHRQLVLSRTRVVTSGDLAERLTRLETSRPGAVPSVILDCRPFILYNVNHVRGAINVNCSDRFNRRRLQLGKATLADLVTAREGKELLRRRQFKEVIVYDDCTDDLEHLPAQHPLFLVLAALVDDDWEPALLIGKYSLISLDHHHWLARISSVLNLDETAEAKLLGDVSRKWNERRLVIPVRDEHYFYSHFPNVRTNSRTCWTLGIKLFQLERFILICRNTD
ncbi:Dual specificity protein phosphatase [Ooceraea biroi]|uniref:Dual specificity protein phosphatase n=1 Tax=Ooceraea biroi TaxID=2015173 RepID=A0A026WC70_OOCBI|nr:Dual specificity protein phosphatase [Ooceraea biroi]